MDEGALDEGRAELDRALELDPNDQAALLLRFWPGDNDLARIQACIPALAAFAEAHPEAAGALRSLARAKVAIGAHEEAATLLARAVGLTPNDDDLRAEHWSALDHLQRSEEVLREAATVSDLAKRDWKLRWNEAEAFKKLGKRVEARAAFSAINFDESLHVDVRRRAKRAVMALGEGAES
jgi:tetratricopeptide (TPR) repeat protein